MKMTPEVAKKVKEYVNYLRTKEYTKFFYHFSWEEAREVYDMLKELGTEVHFDNYSQTDIQSVVCVFRKMMAYSHMYGQTSVDVRISRYGIKAVDTISGEIIEIAYAPSGRHGAWTINLSERGISEPYETESGVGFNNLVEHLIGTHYSIFMDQDPNDYLLKG